MLRTFWSVKGGSGVTVVCAALASLQRLRTASTVVVDLCGDLPAALGLPQPNGPGLSEWCATTDRHPEALARLMVPVHDGLHLLPRGAGPVPSACADELVQALAELGDEVLVDAGRASAGDGGERLLRELDRCGPSYLVSRACYLALRRARERRVYSDGVVVLCEDGRALGAHDVADVLDVPLVASVVVDRAVARSVDSALLVRRVPRQLARDLEPLL